MYNKVLKYDILYNEENILYIYHTELCSWQVAEKMKASLVLILAFTATLTGKHLLIETG